MKRSASHARSGRPRASFSGPRSRPGAAVARKKPPAPLPSEENIFASTAPAESTPSGKRVVRLRFHAPKAHLVFVAGSFNQWNPRVTPMDLSEDGTWVVELNLDPGVYEYRFIADDQWVDDSSAAEGAVNPFGGRNAVLRV